MMRMPLSTNRTCLRAATDNDLAQLYRIEADPLIKKYLSPVECDQSEWVARAEETIVGSDETAVIEFNKSSEIIGTASLSKCLIRDVDAVYDACELRVIIVDQHQSVGLGGEILAAMLEEAEGLGFWSAYGVVHDANLKSKGMLKKFGFRIVGRKREPGGWQDGHEVWLKSVKASTKSKHEGSRP